MKIGNHRITSSVWMKTTTKRGAGPGGRGTHKHTRKKRVRCPALPAHGRAAVFDDVKNPASGLEKGCRWKIAAGK